MKWQRCLHTDATRSRSTAEVSAGPRCSSRGGGTDCGTAQGRCRARCHRVTLHEALRSDAGSLARRRTCLQKVRSRGPDPRCLRSQRGGPVPRAAERGRTVRGTWSTVVTLNAQGSDQTPSIFMQVGENTYHNTTQIGEAHQGEVHGHTPANRAPRPLKRT